MNATLRIIHGLHKTDKLRDAYDAAKYDHKQLTVLIVQEFLSQCKEMGYTFKLVCTKGADVVVVLWNNQYYGQVTDHAVQYFIRTACDRMFEDIIYEHIIWGSTFSSRSLVKQFKTSIEYSDYVSNISV